MEILGVIFWLILALICGGLGASRKVGFWFPFLFSIFLTPIVGFLIAITSTSLETERRHQELLKAQKATTEKPSAASEIEKLKALLESGHITQAEFDALKAKALTNV